MAEATLRDVITRMKAEGQLVRNTGENSIKSVKVELKSIYATMFDQTAILQRMLDLSTSDSDAAERRRQTGQADTSNIIQPINTPNPDAAPASAVPDDTITSALSALKGIGIAAGVIALGLGATVGIVAGQLATIKTLVPGLNSTLGSLSGFFKNFKLKIVNITAASGKILSDTLKFIKNIFGSAGSNSLVAKVLAPIKGYISNIVKIFTGAAKTLGGIFSLAGKASITFTAIKSAFGLLGNAIGKILKVVGKIFAPIAVVITLFDTIKGAIDGFASGGILGGLAGAVTGFFTSLITKPLDLVKDAVAWVIGKFGFDGAAEALSSFSFTELFTDLVGSIFSGVSNVIGLVKGLFTFGEEDFNLLGALGKLTDIVFLPINAVINFVKEMFGFDTSEDPFSMQDFISEKTTEIFEWIGNLFSFLPSVEGIKNTLMSYLPEWMQPESIAAQRKSITDQIAQQRTQIAQGDMRTGFGKSRENIIQDLEAQRDLIPGFSKGSKGFVDFGVGSPAMLHGIEAVVPRNTAAGMFLANNFDKNYEPISKNIANVSTAAIQSAVTAPIVIANAPTIAPVTNNVKGATNYSSQRITTMGDGSGGSGLGRFAN
jgi:hypothetical protein